MKLRKIVAALVLLFSVALLLDLPSSWSRSSSSSSSFSFFVSAQVTTVTGAAETILPIPPQAYDFGPESVLGVNQAIALCSPLVGDKLCYSNWFGHFYFECSATQVLVYACNSSACTSECNVVSTLLPGTANQSKIEHNKQYNWTGVLHDLYAGYVSVAWYDNDNETENCSSSPNSAMRTRYHWPASPDASSGPCLRWVEMPRVVDRASRRWSCYVDSTTGEPVVQQTNFLYAWDCSGVFVTDVRNTSECYEEGMTRWTCSNVTAGQPLQLVVFNRGASAGALRSVAIVFAVSFLLFIFLFAEDDFSE